MNNYDEEYVKKEIAKRNAALTSLIVKVPWDDTSAPCKAIYHAKDALLHYFNEESLRNEDFCTEFALVTLDTVEDYKMQKLLHDACLREPIDFKKFNRELFDNAYTIEQSITVYGFKIDDKGLLREFMKIYTQPLE